MLFKKSGSKNFLQQLLDFSQSSTKLDNNNEVPDPRISVVTDTDEQSEARTDQPSGYGPRDNSSTINVKPEEVVEDTSSATVENMARDDEKKLSRFNGKSTDDYNLWRIRAEIALKGRKLWRKIQDKNCDQDTKDEASSIIVAALGDAALRVCSAKIDDPMEMLDALDERFASKRAGNRISVLTTLFTKRYKNGQDMPKFIDEFESLFDQLEKMGDELAVPESYKAPLLLTSLGTKSNLESAVAALRLRDVDDLTWETVTADLIQEFQRSKSANISGNGNQKDGNPLPGASIPKKYRKAYAAMKNADKECSFCGKNGHTSEMCWVNPESKNCRIPEKAQASIKAMKADQKKEGEEKRVKFGSRVTISKALKTRQIEDHKTVLDSGASVTMFKAESEAEKDSYVKGSDVIVHVAAGSESTPCLGTGSLKLDKLTVPDSLHVKDLNDSLVSVGHICDSERIIVFTANEAVILNVKNFSVVKDDIIEVVPRDKDTKLYVFPSKRSSAKRASKDEKSPTIVAENSELKKSRKSRKVRNETAYSAKLELWHNRLVHINEVTLKKLHKHVNDFPKLKGKLKSCHPCQLGKAKRKSFKSHFKPAKYPGEIVHSDLAGPLPMSMDGALYACTFMDQYSRFTHAAGLRSKSDAVEATESYKVLEHVKKYFPKGVERLHTDGGGEYENADVNEHSETTPHTPQHNPFAERFNRTFLEPIRTMLEQTGLSGKYWEYAMDHVAYIKNRTPHKALGCSPYEKLLGTKPTLKYVRVFGCAAFVYEHDPKSKVHARAVPAVMLGCNDHGIYTVERLTDRKIINSVHVTFDEESFPKLEDSSSSSSGEESEYSPSESSNSFSSQDAFELPEEIYSEEESEQSEKSPTIVGQNFSDDDSESGVIGVSGTQPDTDLEPQRESERNESLRRSTRVRKAPKRYGLSCRSAINFPITTSDSPSMREAMNATKDEVELWRRAIDAELLTLEKKSAWVKIGSTRNPTTRFRTRGPKGEIILPTHVVLKIKRDEMGNPEKFKARVVAGGNFQIQGKDYDSVYAPVVDFTMVLTVLCIIVHYDWYKYQVDIKAAFLNGDIDRETFVGHPNNLPEDMQRTHYYKLRKALYGLCQAPLRWFVKLRESLENLGFHQLNANGSVFLRQVKIGEKRATIVVLCYVDDLIFTGTNKNELKRVVDEFLKTFEGKLYDTLSWYLSVRLEWSKGLCKVSQSAYVHQILTAYGLENIRAYNTPMASSFYEELHKCQDQPVEGISEYESMIGALIYLSSRTRPDISTAVGILSRYQAKPTKFLMNQLKRVFGYLKGTAEYGITISQKSEFELVFYCDSDFAGLKEDRKSRTGWIGLLGGTPITWASHKQSCNSLSTAESEYVALSECCQEIKWIRLFLAEIGISQSKPTWLLNDNTAAESWSNEYHGSRRAKHIDVRYHYVRSCVYSNAVQLVHVDSNKNLADCLTKPLPRVNFQKFCHIIGLQ